MATMQRGVPMPAAVCRIIRRLNGAGYEAWAVGGCARDSLMGRTPNDWDLCTSARPEQVAAVFADCRVLPTGIAHGTQTVLWEGVPYEITTYRVEGAYSDGRHPDVVAYTDRLEQDLARRDFTMNALAAHPELGLVDPFHGIEDLRAGVLRAVGDPARRFEEDALRILRALRFAAKYDLTVEPATAQAARELAPRLCNVSRERVTQELWSLLSAPDGEAAARILEEFRPVVLQVLPELTACVGFEQRSPWHEYDVWEHQLRTLAAVEPLEGEDLPLVRLTALLHDVGKPACCTEDPDGTRHFCGHWDVGADMVREMLNTQLRLPAQVRDTIVDLVRIHDHPMEPTPRTVRRALSSLGEHKVRQWMALHRADLIAHGLPEQRRKRLLEELDKTVGFAALLEEELARAACLNLRDLAVKGGDLIALGFAPGPALGRALHALLEAVMDERVENRREPLLEEARRLLTAPQ